jgi:hypothetical protein
MVKVLIVSFLFLFLAQELERSSGDEGSDSEEEEDERKDDDVYYTDSDEEERVCQNVKIINNSPSLMN